MRSLSSNVTSTTHFIISSHLSTYLELSSKADTLRKGKGAALIEVTINIQAIESQLLYHRLRGYRTQNTPTLAMGQYTIPSPGTYIAGCMAREDITRTQRGCAGSSAARFCCSSPSSRRNGNSEVGSELLLLLLLAGWLPSWRKTPRAVVFSRALRSAAAVRDSTALRPTAATIPRRRAGGVDGGSSALLLLLLLLLLYSSCETSPSRLCWCCAHDREDDGGSGDGGRGLRRHSSGHGGTQRIARPLSLQTRSSLVVNLRSLRDHREVGPRSLFMPNPKRLL